MENPAGTIPLWANWWEIPAPVWFPDRSQICRIPPPRWKWNRRRIIRLDSESADFRIRPPSLPAALWAIRRRILGRPSNLGIRDFPVLRIIMHCKVAAIENRKKVAAPFYDSLQNLLSGFSAQKKKIRTQIRFLFKAKFNLFVRQTIHCSTYCTLYLYLYLYKCNTLYLYSTVHYTCTSTVLYTLLVLV